MSKKKNKEKKSSYKIDNRSTRETFLKWLDECGNDLLYFSGVLSCCGSDGPNITLDKVGKAHFNMPEEVEDYLQDQGLYEEMDVICDTVHYNPPSKHYIDWFKEKIIHKNE
jgi:hypothetical protein